jgi:hypothetical protein
MQSKILQLFFVNVVYPLAQRLVGYIIDKYILEKSKKAIEKKQQKRKEIIKELKNASSNEERRALSIRLASLNK